MFWIAILAAAALLYAAIYVFRKGDRIPAVLFGVIALVAIAFIVLPGLLKIDVNWSFGPTLLLALTLGFLATAVGTGRPMFGFVGVVLLVWLLCVTMAWPWWTILLALVSAVAMGFAVYTGEDELLYNRPRRTIFAILACVGLVATFLVGGLTAKPKESMLYNELVTQLQENNQSFVDWADFCEKAEPGSGDALICSKVNHLEHQVNQNSDDISDLRTDVEGIKTQIETLTGQIAEVTEKVNAAGTVVQSPGGLSDEQAAAAIASQLAAAGWNADDVRINNVDLNSYTLVPGPNVFTAVPLTTKALLVQELNSNAPAAQARLARWESDPVYRAERDRVLSGEGYYAIQFTRAVCTSGNTYWDGSTAGVEYNTICHNAGDLYWIYVDRQGNIDWNLTVRAACANGEVFTAPAPQGAAQAEVCPPGTDRAGQMVGSGCDNPTVVTPTPTETVTTTAPPPTTTTPPPPSETTAPPETCPPGQHGTPPVCKDDPVNDPAQQGNAGNGGGQNEHSGPGATTEPTAAPTTERTDPPPPQATAEVPRTSEAPAPETSAPEPTTPATGVACAPGEINVDGVCQVP